MRSLHRGLSLVLGLFMLVIACSGLWLQLEALTSGGWTVGRPPASAASAAAGAPAPPPAGGTRAPLAAVPPQRPLHLLLLRLHRGDLFGPVGTWISVVCGLGLVVLTLTGAWVYIDMVRRRFMLGRRSFFW